MLKLGCLLSTQVSKLGKGNYGVTMLLRNRETAELVAGKFIERGGMVRLMQWCRRWIVA